MPRIVHRAAAHHIRPGEALRAVAYTQRSTRAAPSARYFAFAHGH